MRVLVYKVECCEQPSEIWGDEYHGIVQVPRYYCTRCGREPRITWNMWGHRVEPKAQLQLF